MVIGYAISISCILLMIPIKRKLYWKWAALVLLGLASIYYFYVPNRTEDLYRYYNVLEMVRQKSQNAMYLLDTYRLENPVFIVYLYIIGLFQKNAFLPIVTGTICYYICLFFLKKVFDERNGYHWQIVICMCIGLMLIRFMDISGVRNILASTLFAYALYLDLVEKQKNIYFLYIFAALIHSIALVYIALRLILLFYYKYNKSIILFIMISTSVVVSNFSYIIMDLLSNNTFASSIFSRFMIYLNNQSGINLNERYRLLYACMYILISMIVLIYDKFFDAEGHYKKLTDYFFVLIFFTFGFWGQREMFNRERMLIIPIGLVYIGELLKQVSGRYVLSVVIPKSGRKRFGYILGAILVYALLVFSFIYFILVIRKDYAYYNGGFVL